MLRSVSGWSGPSLAFLQLERLLVQRHASEYGRRRCSRRQPIHARERVEVVGTDLRLASLSALRATPRFRVPAEGTVAGGEVDGRCFLSVSGWSGPSLAFRNLSVPSSRAGASACRPRREVTVGEVGHAPEGDWVVGAEPGGEPSARAI